MHISQVHANVNNSDCYVVELALTCTNGMVRAASASPCLPTCDNPDADKKCDKPFREICVCPSGQILFQGRCVSVCGCIDNNGVARDVGSHWLISAFAARKFKWLAFSFLFPHYFRVAKLTVWLTVQQANRDFIMRRFETIINVYRSVSTWLCLFYDNSLLWFTKIFTDIFWEYEQLSWCISESIAEGNLCN